ncbi:MAG: mechanosensitive ion channel family protein [Deferribacterales bacterium]
MPFENEVLIRVAATVFAVLVLLTLRKLSVNIVMKKEFIHKEQKMRAVIYTRKVFMTLIILSVSFIWLTHIKDFAISITALAVAIVIATKELILCVSGGILKNYAQSYRIGDRVRIGEYRGDVVNYDLLSTTILEIGPGEKSHQYTGRSISVPNSMFLSLPLVNETLSDDYMLHVFTIPLNAASDWQRAEQELLKASNEIVSEYKEEAQKLMEKIGSKTGFEAPNADPRVTITLPDKDTIHLMVRVPVPSRRKGKIEQAILRRFLESFKGFGEYSSPYPPSN